MIIKPVVIMILGALCSGMVGCYAHEHDIKTLTYTEDYSQMYANELEQIFGDYILGKREEIHIEGEECDCGYHKDTVDYYEWNITYTDSCGQTIECRLNNCESIYHQQYEWLEDQVETHFYDNYMMKYFGELMNNEAGSYCFCFLGDFCNGYSDEVERSHVETGEKYVVMLYTNTIFRFNIFEQINGFNKYIGR